MPELLDGQDWIDRRAVVDDCNAKGNRLSYYDHLLTDECMPLFDSETKAQAYAADFD